MNENFKHLSETAQSLSDLLKTYGDQIAGTMTALSISSVLPLAWYAAVPAAIALHESSKASVEGTKIMAENIVKGKQNILFENKL